ncbi:MAG: hypothetical protein LBC88_04945 [Spirochaetaceae bacterium]|jgi:hypothetical protein|nr:hypothetical protein [Spirochaetaceae bacterium]
MTGWDVLNTIVTGFPPVAATLFLVAALVAVIMFMVGFSRHGLDFLKHGFRQTLLSELMEKLATKEDIAALRMEVDGIRTEVDGLRTELDEIKVNHFGHLKKYLGVLNGILLDKNIIDNESKARLDNELLGM